MKWNNSVGLKEVAATLVEYTRFDFNRTYRGCSSSISIESATSRSGGRLSCWVEARLEKG